MNDMTELPILIEFNAKSSNFSSLYGLWWKARHGWPSK